MASVLGRLFTRQHASRMPNGFCLSSTGIQQLACVMQCLLPDSMLPAGGSVPDHDHVPDCSHHLHCGGGLSLLGCAEHPGPAAPPLQ